MNKVTPELIKHLGFNDIFVFGSNEQGLHGAGAALTAKKKWGARTGQGFGLAGRTFAIPTKDFNIRTLPLEVINFYVSRFNNFLYHGYNSKHFDFYVTEIGCGLAGYTPKDIAPMFKDASKHKHVYLPQSFWDVLNS